MPISFDEFCLNLQENLNAVAGENGNPILNRQPTGFIDALVSSENTAGMEVDSLLDKGDGKINTVQLKYLKPDSVSDATSTITDLCEEEGVEHAYVYDEPELTEEVASSVTLVTEDQIRTLCESGQEFWNRLVLGKMNSVMRKMNETLIAQFVSGAGNFWNGDAGPNSYAFLNNDSGIYSPDVNGEVMMMRDIQNTGAVGRPIVVGGGNIDHYRRLQQYGCCNNVGLDNSKIADFDFYYDQFMDSVLASASEDNMFFAWAPRAAQLLTKCYNKGQFAKTGSDFTFNTIVDPRTGIEYDFELFYDKCSPRGYKMRLSLRYGLWQLPLDMFKSTDDRYQVNYNMLFAATVS